MVGIIVGASAVLLLIGLAVFVGKVLERFFYYLENREQNYLDDAE